MKPENPASSPLIADSDPDFLLRLRSDPRAKLTPPILVATEKDATNAIIDVDRQISSIFISANFKVPHSLPLIRFALQHRPVTPLYYLTDEATNLLGIKELKGLAIRQIIKKPVTFSELVKYATSTELAFDPTEAIMLASKSATGSAEPSSDDSDYVPIIATNFTAGTSSFFDVYVKLGGARYLKILQAGDAFSPDRIATYLSKGVTHFFLRREAQEHYLKYCDHLTTVILKNREVGQDIKVAQTLNHGQETLSFLRNSGVNDRVLQHSQKFVANVHTLIEQINVPSKHVLTKFLKDVGSYEHGAATTVIASMLVGPLKFEAEKSVHIVGLASLLHDIGLQKMPDKLKNENEVEMSAEEIQEYWTHPTIGAEMLRKIAGIEPTVAQAVEQHHERRSRKGFPNRLGSGGINRVAEIVGLSNEFVLLIAEAIKNPKLDPMAQMERRVFNSFSNPVIEAFRSIFNDK